ncbi:TPA: acyltransferase family protein [Klebsiella quasipneumoniae subsp. similipneumoniae]
MNTHPTPDMKHTSNCFDIIRHAAAYLVMISHHYALNGFPEPKIFESTKLGTFAVIIFFSISGYLITNSFLNSTNSYSYMKKRTLRIFPGLIACSSIMTLLIFPFFGIKNNALDWLLSLSPIKSFLYFSLFGSPGAGEIVNGFTSNYIFNDSANGSLWSLKFEFLDYIAIMLIFSLIKKPILGSIVFLTISAAGVLINNKYHISDYYFYRAAAYSIPFAMGSLLFATRNIWQKHCMYKYILMTLAFIGLLATPHHDELGFPILFLVPVVIIMMGFSFKDFLIKGRFDISYGVYIYAFPIQQIISNHFPGKFGLSFTISLIATTAMSLASWFIIEKRFLARKNK